MIKKLLLIIIFICIATLLFFTWQMDYFLIINARFALLLSVILYHTIVDKKYSCILIITLILFVLSDCFSIVFNYTSKINTSLVIWANVFSLLSYLLLLVWILRAQKFMFDISKKSIIIIVLLVLDFFIIQQYASLMNIIEVGITHTSLGILYPIIKLVLLTVIISYYLSNNNFKATVLAISVVCFLLSDVAEISQFLFFINKSVRSLVILDVGLDIVGLYLLYESFSKSKDFKIKTLKD